jgi:hypothetical protein
MASKSETGHAINISNFKRLIDICTGFGIMYNPSNLALTIASMTILWTTADTAEDTLTKAMGAATNPINMHEKLNASLDKLITRTINYYKSCKPSSLADAKSLANTIRGFGVKVVRLPNGDPDPAHISTSHLSYVQRATNFNQLIALYIADPNYAPNETDLTIVSLTALYTQLKAGNDNIGTIIEPVDTARDTRDAALYTPETGILDTAQDGISLQN